MKEQLEIIRKTRESFVLMCKNLSIELMNKIPEGYNNNLIWNFGHIIAVQQGLCYGLAGLPMNIDRALVEKYCKGTRPETFITADEYETLKSLSISLIDIFESDISKGIFKEIKPMNTALGVEITNFEQAVKFNTFHEGLHFGYSMALKRAVKNSG